MTQRLGNRLGLVAVVLCAAHASGSPPTMPGVFVERPMPAEFKPAVAESERLGKLLFDADTASAHATDALLGKTGGTPDPRVRGWLTEATRDGAWDVPFFTADEPPRILCTVHVDAEGAHLAWPQNERDATGAERAMIAARRTAGGAVHRMCGTGLNPVVLPGSAIGRDGWLVYVLQGTTRNDEQILAGHQRFLVSKDGTRILEEKPMSKGCLTSRSGDAPKGARVANYVSSIVADAPLETHVFESLQYRMPLFVTTDKGTWMVEKGRIFAADHPEPQTSPECKEPASKLSLAQREACCAQHEARQCQALAKTYAQGDGVARDVARAAEYETRAKQRWPPVEKDCPHCEPCMKADADIAACTQHCEKDTDDARVCILLAQAKSKAGDTAEAERLAGLACEKKRGEGCTQLAVIFAQTHDFERTLAPLERGCELEDEGACGWLGLLYVSGQRVKKDEAKGARMLGLSCAKGYPQGCDTLALVYEKGAGVPHDEVRAGELYQKACDADERGTPYPKACYTLGDLYDKGKWLPEDKPRARALFEKACNEGLPEGCGRLQAMDEMK